MYVLALIARWKFPVPHLELAVSYEFLSTADQYPGMYVIFKKTHTISYNVLALTLMGIFPIDHLELALSYKFLSTAFRYPGMYVIFKKTHTISI